MSVVQGDGLDLLQQPQGLAGQDKPEQGRLERVLNRLVDLSLENHYDVYRGFHWPERVPDDQLWMSPELVSVHATPHAERLSESQLIRLSQYEFLNFCSVNVHGIRELLLAVLQRIHKAGFEAASEYFHHFISEENDHMWFFAQFCLRYGTLYQSKNIHVDSFTELDLRDFVVFAKIMIFEEIGDYYNVFMRDDERLPPIVRQLNDVHHRDESRHLAMGAELIKQLFEHLRDRYSAERLREVAEYLKRYMVSSLTSFYNPWVYRDAGLSGAHTLRREVFESAGRRQHHQRVLRRVTRRLQSIELFQQGECAV